MSCIRSALRELPQSLPVAYRDKVPGLCILRALRPPASMQDRADRFFRQGFISKLANSALGTDQFGDRHTCVPPLVIADDKQSRSAFHYKW